MPEERRVGGGPGNLVEVMGGHDRGGLAFGAQEIDDLQQLLATGQVTPVIDGTHGPAHRPMSKYRHGRPARARWSKKEFEHVRTGNTRVSASSVSRMA